MKTTQEKIAVMQAYYGGLEKMTYEEAMKWRNYKSREEIESDMKTHGPKVARGVGRPLCTITKIEVVSGDCRSLRIRHIPFHVDRPTDLYWQDGTPFGRKEDEV